MYRSWWQVVRASSWPLLTVAICGPVAVAGCVAAAALTWVLPVATSAAGALVSLVIAEENVGHRNDNRRTLVTAGCTWSVCLAVLGMVVLPLTAPRALLISALVAAAATTPILARGRNRLGRARDAWPVPARFAVQPPGCRRAVVHEAGDEQLCWMWDESAQDVARARDPDSLVPLVDLRRMLLDELERRNPRAFARWLDQPDLARMRRYLVGGGG